MGKISIDLNSLKAAGIYTLEVDNSQRTTVEVNNALRMVVGFSNKGTFNRPVLLLQDTDRLSIFGDVDAKMEHKGCYFNRMLRTLLTDGPVIALNLLDVSTSYNGPDQVNYSALSLNAGKENPVLHTKLEKYGEYDYLGETVDKKIYETAKGSVIPYVGTTPFSSVYNRSRFWVPDKDLLLAAASRGLTKSGDTAPETFEKSNLLNFANVGTEEMSILVFKAGNMAGYDVTAESWYGGKENIPFGWVRPYDYISDYFLQVICIKGNWSNYPVLSTDPVWGSYFDKNGIKKDKLNNFLTADGISVLGNWSGIIIPDFVDKQGNYLSLEKKINAVTEKTGLLMSLNEEALDLLTYDYTGKNTASSFGEKGCWGLDIDGDNEIDEEKQEVEAPYIVDMVGHEAFAKKESKKVEYDEIEYVPGVNSSNYITVDSSITGFRAGKENTVKTTIDLLLIRKEENTNEMKVEKIVDDTTVITYSYPGVYIAVSNLIDASVLTTNPTYDKEGIKSIIDSKYHILHSTALIQNKKVAKDTLDVSITSTTEAIVKMNCNEDIVKLVLDVSVDSNNCITAASVNKVELKNGNEVNSTETIDPVYGINFLSYNYISNENDGVQETISNVQYFSDPTLWEEESPVNIDVKNMIIIKDASMWQDNKVKVGDLLRNITFENNEGETEQYMLIPGLTKVIKKQFINIRKDENTLVALYNGKKYEITGSEEDYPESYTGSNQHGFYLITTTAPILVKENTVVRQLPMSDNKISGSLRFIPMKGLQVTSKHRPGYDKDGNLDIEAGIEKIYGVLEEKGINRGLMNPEMVNYRYIIDTMSYGLRSEMGGKAILSKTAKQRKKCTAILNLPSAKQFAVSCNPYFCDTFIPEFTTRPGLNTKYIPEGGNTEMGSTAVFSLPTYENGASFTACFWPNVIYTENGKTISMPPAADVANVLNRKFTGLTDPYCICANTNGILSNRYLTGLEFLADLTDREALEPFGVNTIIKDGRNIMIYGNQTAYQTVKSDLNKLHVRENLNTAEIECEAVLKKFNFLYNTPAVRANLVALLTPILQSMQTSGALAQYEIICDESNNGSDVIEADACVVEIGLWFNHGMEKIVQQFTINRHSTIIE